MAEYKSTAAIAATVRASLKTELPEWKFSVRVKTFSMGASISVSLMAGPEQVLEGYAPQRGVVADLPLPDYAQLNRYQFNDTSGRWSGERISNGVVLTPKGWEVMGKAVEILSREHWDKSDMQTDYFCTNFYMHVEIGQWDKPYTVKGGK
jgi:exopolysaccharide biosynthesis protein